MTTVATLTTTQHTAAARRDQKLADHAYDMAETVRDRATAWKWRRQAEQLVESAARHLDLAERVLR